MPAAPQIQGYGAGLRWDTGNKKAANAARAGYSRFSGICIAPAS